MLWDMTGESGKRRQSPGSKNEVVHAVILRRPSPLRETAAVKVIRMEPQEREAGNRALVRMAVKAVVQ